MFLFSGEDLLCHAQRLALATGGNGCSLADYVANRKVIDLAAARERLRPVPAASQEERTTGRREG